MKVAVEARALTAPTGGIRRYVRQLAHWLPLESPEDQFTFLLPSTGGWRLGVWYQWGLPRQIGKIKPDVVHFTKSAVTEQTPWPTVVTIYDVIPLLFAGSQAWSRRWYWPRTLAVAAKRSNHILTISEVSKKDIAAHFQVPLSKISVTPLAVDTKFFRPVPALPTMPTPYILYVGTIEPRKNIPTLIRSFTAIAGKIPHHLVLAGRRGLHHQSVIREVRQLPYNRQRVHWIEFVSADDLPAVYSGAELFVFPSVYEGWGFPPLEAMACGVPVVVSNGGALPEVVGQAAEVISFSTSDLKERTHDWQFEHDLADAILRLLHNDQKRAWLHQRGLEQARLFSWEKVAHKTIEVYRKVCAR